MPPQVQPPVPDRVPVSTQGSGQMEESKSTQADPKPAEPPKQDPQTAAKNAEAAKQHAAGRNQQNVADAEMKRNELHQKVPKKNTDKAGTTTMPQQRKPSGKQSDDGAWGFIKDATRLASDAAGAGVEVLRNTTTNAAAVHLLEKTNKKVMEAQDSASNYAKRQGVERLQQSQYPQDMVKGQYFEVEKITPGKTDTFKNNERVEDRGRGDVVSRHYHQETQRTSTQSGLEDRLQVLNAGKELTQFEKGLISEWDPQMKGTGKNDPIKSVSPILGMDSKGGGPTGVQAYKVQRGNYSTYYDRNGNVLVDEGTKQNRVVNMDRRKHQQDMVKGEYYVAEQITPGSADKTKTSETVDVVKQRIHKEQNRTSTQAGLENRLKELNPGKDLTPFEKGLVNEWDPKMKGNNGKDGITSLSPVMGLDSAGKTSTEVQAYKVARGVSGNHEVTYYDRNGNELMMHKTGGEAIPTDGPVDYIYLAKLGAEALLKKGVEIGEKYFAKEAVEKGVAKEVAADSVAIASSAERQAAKDGITTAERRTATQSQHARPQEQWEEINAANKQGNKEMSKTTREEMDKAGNTSSEVKDPHVKEKNPAESTKPADAKGAKVSKTDKTPRQMEVEKELREVESELETARDHAGDLVQVEIKGTGQQVDTDILKARLRDVARKGDQRARDLLDQIEDLERRRGDLRRERGGFPGNSDFW